MNCIYHYGAKGSHFLWGKHIHDARIMQQLCISAQSTVNCPAAAVRKLCQDLIKAMIGPKSVQESLYAVSGREGYVRVALPV